MKEFVSERIVWFIGIASVFFAPIAAAMIAAGILISIDTVMGVMGAKKLGEKITSKKLGAVITKMIVYQLLIISAHLCELYLAPIIPFTKITLGFIATVEFLSIGENFTKITGKNITKYIKTYLDRKFRGLIQDETRSDSKKDS